MRKTKAAELFVKEFQELFVYNLSSIFEIKEETLINALKAGRLGNVLLEDHSKLPKSIRHRNGSS